MTPARRERLSIGLLAAGLCWPLVGTPGFCLDDSFIHLAYVQSIRLGQGISYNPGDWETGITSPLWVALLACWPLGVPTVFGIKCFGALLHAATAMLVAATARAAAPELGARFSFSAGLLAATTPLLVQGATSGMEVPLASLLCVAVSFALLREAYAAAAVLAALAYLARPESLVYAGALALLLALQRRSPRPLLALAGAATGMLAFFGYCYGVSGYVWPNTYYVKGEGLSWSSLSYLAIDVSLWQPVIVSGTGVLLVGYGLVDGFKQARDKAELPLPAAVLAAGVCTLLAIALSRTLYPGVHFFQSRYFAIVLWVLPLAAGYGFARLASAARWALMAPLVVVTGLLLYDNTRIQLAQERGVARLHVEPAAYIARKLPDARVLGVEGAGALRYLTPRSLRVVDLMGLNERAIAHLDGTLFHKLCYLQRRKVTHLAYPAQWRENVHKAFVLQDLALFTEPAYAQMQPPAPWQLSVARVTEPRPDFAAFCRRAQP
jgi:hypothetical protein